MWEYKRIFSKAGHAVLHETLSLLTYFNTWQYYSIMIHPIQTQFG